MKKNLAYLGILVVLLIVAGILISRKPASGTLEDRKMDYNFTIKDTASIDKIVIKDKTPAEVTLTREGDHWLVNGKERARKDAIDILLLTLHRMQMRNFIPENLKETVIKRMTVYGKEVQIYRDGKHFKTIYVGTEAADDMATYMMIEGADAPYAVFIPGFNGYLSSRFFADARLWKSRDIVRLEPHEIREVRMLYPDSASASFSIHVSSPDSAFLRRLSDNKIIRNVNRVKLIGYLNNFRRLSYEGAIIPSDPIFARKDSLLASVPVFELDITEENGRTTKTEGFRIKGPCPEGMDPEDCIPFDPDRMHGVINEDQMVLLQYAGLNKVLKGLEYFTKP